MKPLIMALSICIVTISCGTSPQKKTINIKPKPRPSPPEWKINYKRNEFNELTNQSESISNSYKKALFWADLLSIQESRRKDFERLRLRLKSRLGSSYITDSQSQSKRYIGFTNYVYVSRLADSFLVAVGIIGIDSSNVMIRDSPSIAIRIPKGIIRLRGHKGRSPMKRMGVVYIYGNDALKFIYLMTRYSKLEVSFQGFGDYYVINVNCRGFAEAWQKTGWRFKTPIPTKTP